MKKGLSVLLAALLAVGVLVGCSSEAAAPSADAAAPDSGEISGTSVSGPAQIVNDTTDATTYPLTVTNIAVQDDGAVWAEKDQVFESAPQRIVCNMQGAAELLIRLGLGDKIVGVAAVFGDVDPAVKGEFDKIPVLSEGYAGQEVILGAGPDIVIGSGHFFVEADYGSGTVDFLNETGIHSYILNASKEGANFDDFFKDIDELGRIFDVQEAAQALTDQYQGQISDLTSDPRWSGQTKTLAQVATVEDGNFTVSSGKGETFQNDAVELIGLENIFKDAPGAEVSNEDFIKSNPDVIMLFWYNGGPDMDAMIEQLYQMEELQDVTAIKEKQVYAADFNAFYGGGGGIFDAVGALAGEVWGA
jgi:iron complex transport system substrate-binding protein